MGDVWAMESLEIVGRSSRAAGGNLSTHHGQLMLLFNVRSFFAGSDKLCLRNGSKVVKGPAVVFILKTKQSQALYEPPKGGVDPACFTFLQELSALNIQLRHRFLAGAPLTRRAGNDETESQ